jgi:hypothetical protein
MGIGNALDNGKREAGPAAMTSANWTTIVNSVYNTLPAAAKPYGKINYIRLTLNSQMYMGYPCVLPFADDKGSYTAVGGLFETGVSAAQIQADLDAEVAAIRGAGLYVSLDMHSATGILASTGQYLCGVGQNGMPSAADVAFWTLIASKYKNDSGVMFELFNEPFYDGNYGNAIGAAGVAALGGAGTVTIPCVMYDNIGNPSLGATSILNGAQCKFTGEQALINAIRSTGATNIIWSAPPWYAQGLAQWLQMKLSDPAKQLGMTFHAYSSGGGISAFNAVAAAGYPILMTEGGCICNIGTNGTYKYFGQMHWGYTWWAGNQNGQYNNWGEQSAAQITAIMAADPPWNNNGSAAPTGSN